MSVNYSKAWFAYFRADANADEAAHAYIAAYVEDPTSAVTVRAYEAAVTARRKAFAAEDYAEAVTEGTEPDSLQEALADLSKRAAEAKREAEREVRRRSGLKGYAR
jgi:hypothetical protein